MKNFFGAISLHENTADSIDAMVVFLFWPFAVSAVFRHASNGNGKHVWEVKFKRCGLPVI